MTLHPRERRRDAAPAVHPAVGARRRRRRSRRRTLLAACGGDDDDGGGEAGGAVKLSRPDDPATLPTFDDIPAIADGLSPESGTLKVYNYEEYISPDVLAAFEERVRRQGRGHDVHQHGRGRRQAGVGRGRLRRLLPDPRRVGKLAAGKLLQPLNKSYLPNLTNVWESLQDPFYDQGSVYTVPYTLFTTGIGYRIDAVAKPPDDYENPYDIFWDAANAGQVYLLEDDREVFGDGDAPARSPRPTSTPRTPRSSSRPRRRDRADRPRQRQGRRRGLHRAAREAGAGSTSAGPATSSTRSTTCPRASRSTTSATGTRPTAAGSSAATRIAVLRSATKPVLAHAFLDYLLDAGQRPGRTTAGSATSRRRSRSTPTRLVADGVRARAPGARRSSARRTSTTGEQLLQLTPRRRAGLGRRLVDVHGRRLTRRPPRPAVDGRRLWPALAAPGVLWLVALFSSRSTACSPSPSAGSTRSSAPPSRCGTRCEWDFASFGDILERVFGGELGEVFVRTAAVRRRGAGRSAS